MTGRELAAVVAGAIRTKGHLRGAPRSGHRHKASLLYNSGYGDAPKAVRIELIQLLHAKLQREKREEFQDGFLPMPSIREYFERIPAKRVVAILEEVATAPAVSEVNSDGG